MELVLVIVRLWRRRIAVGAGLLVAAACAFAMGPTPGSVSAVAWSRVIVDTKDSQLVVAAPKAGDTTSWRAEFLTHLMTTEDVVARIARQARVPEDSVEVVEPELDVPILRTSMAFAASEAAKNDSAPYMLRVSTDVTLPLIFVSAAAPTVAEARALAEAAVVELRSASNDGAPYTSRFVTGGGESAVLEPLAVTRVSPVRAELVTESGGRMRNAVFAVILFLFWCGGVALLPELVRGIRSRLWSPVPERPASTADARA